MKQQTFLVEVFDPAMCCSTGVCGPDVNDVLTDFANDVKWLKSRGINITRYNLGQEPGAFTSNARVMSRLQQQGSNVLPLILINGSIVSEGGYPSREQLSAWVDVDFDNTQRCTPGSGCC